MKVGSAVLAPDGVLDPPCVERLASDLASQMTGGRRVVLVSSGAIASGFGALGLKKPPKTIVLKQAAAAVGQPRLMRAYGEAFAKVGLATGQVLLTGDDFDSRTRLMNARATLEALLDAGVVPIVNENDSVSYAEIKLGDNDRLGALVAGLVGADLLLILSTARGLYEHGDPARVIPVVEPGSDAARHVRAQTSSVGTGGMESKLAAVATAAAAGVPTVIAGGRDEAPVRRVLDGETLGTFFPCGRRGIQARKRWVGLTARPRGVLTVDAGAAEAIRRRGASLLPSGIRGVAGSFEAGAVVEIRSGSGREARAVGRGVTAYSSSEIARIKGKRSGEIAAVLGYVYRDEVVHRDDLHVASEAGA